MTLAPAAAAERAARSSYGRLVALLATAAGQIELAEDALADAFERALTTWPVSGVPANPEGWLLTVARNRQRDVWKSTHYRGSVSLDEAAGIRSGAGLDLEDVDPDAIPERRLALLFVCGHPAISESARTPLMLQTVLGFDSARIASAYALPPGAMQQRLVRAKRRVRQARIPFQVPGRSLMPERLPPVLEAIYGCYALAGGDGGLDSPAEEARYLATTLATLLRDEPEAWSLAGLVTLAAARRRTDADSYLPLDEQDPTSWDWDLIDEGESYLTRAQRSGGVPGRFQLEAAIQAVHCDSGRHDETDWSALSILYAALNAVAPSLGSRVAQAAVVSRVSSPENALALLEALPPERERFQPYHATRADVLARAGRDVEAVEAYRRAAELVMDPATEAFLAGRANCIASAARPQQFTSCEQVEPRRSRSQ